MNPKRATTTDPRTDRQEDIGNGGTTGTGTEREADEQAPAADEDVASTSDSEQRSDIAPAGLAAEFEAFRDRHLRLAAEYDNYRKRTERERAESWTRAQAQLTERLLDPVDDLQRVANFDAAATSADSLLEGVQLVERKMLRVLEAAGLEIIDAEDQPFDPAIHEALVTTPTETREEDDTVAEVFQKGYRFNGVLLRPARVRVRKYAG